MSQLSEYRVRLKPYDPKKGHKIRQYMVFGIRFEESKGWYRVPAVFIRYNNENEPESQIDVVDYLRQVRQDNDDPDSPLAFDVCTPAEAKALDDAVKAAKARAVASAENPRPIDLVSPGLGQPRPISKKRKAAQPEVPAAPVKRGRGRPPKAKPIPPMQ